MRSARHLRICMALLLGPMIAHAGLQTDVEKAAREFGADAARYHVEPHVLVRMRDGVRLSTSVIRPKAGAPAPTVLIRTPYDVAAELRKSFFRTLFANNYAVVMQNERGTHWSEGDYRMLGGARNDGYDTLTWIAARPWSNGRVGTYGCSSAAENQLALGTLRHPAHRAMIAMSAGAGVGAILGVWSQGLFYKGGVPLFAPWALWYARFGHTYRPRLPADLLPEQRLRIVATYSPEPTVLDGESTQKALTAAMLGLPSAGVLQRLGIPASNFDTFITMAPGDARWKDVDLITAKDTDAIPTLHVNTWGDVGPYETLKLFEFQQHHPEQYLIMAPTAHCEMLNATADTLVGERRMGDARLPYEELYLAWFDRHLRGNAQAFTGQPKVRIHLMGTSTWLTDQQWPLGGTQVVRYHLHSRGAANSLFGDGVLATVRPRTAQPPDQFSADPNNPVPSRGGGCCDRNVFRDQSDLETRNDVLVYSTPPLEAGLAVVGNVTAVLYVSTSARDADVAVKLLDVYPDGRAFNLHDTILRLRYRDGFEAPKLAQPGEIYRVELTGIVTANYFAPEHRLRIEITGSNFPTHELNLHTGGRNYDEEKGIPATTRIYHDANRASYVRIPVYSGYRGMSR